MLGMLRLSCCDLAVLLTQVLLYELVNSALAQFAVG